MTDPETRIRKALALLRARYRVAAIPQADDEAVSGILAAIGEGAPVPSGVITADGPAAAHALAGLKERAEGMDALAREVLGAFTKGSNGRAAARVSNAQVEEWRERLGGS